MSASPSEEPSQRRAPPESGTRLAVEAWEELLRA
jgi:hypothetical protein